MCRCSVHILAQTEQASWSLRPQPAGDVSAPAARLALSVTRSHVHVRTLVAPPAARVAAAAAAATTVQHGGI